MAIQQMLLGVGGAAEKTYMEDVFSTHLYEGNGSTNTINTGVDLSTGNDGLVWIKKRTGSEGTNVSDHMWFSKDLHSESINMYLRSNSSGSVNYENNGLTSFNNNGFSLGSGARANDDGEDYVAWTFKEKPGFFDIIEYTGEGDNSQITVNHNLGSVPGFIALKRQGSDSWICWHLFMGYGPTNAHYIKLDSNHAMGTDGASPPNASINSATSTQLVIGKDNNASASYMVYLWAGGESGASTAKSMYWNDGSDRLNVGSSSSKSADFNFGSNDLTIECWIKAGVQAGDKPNIICIGDDDDQGEVNLTWDHEDYSNKIAFWSKNKGSTPFLISPVHSFDNDSHWHHIAVTRASNVWRLFVDGVEEAKTTWTGDTTDANEYLCIGNTTTGAQTSNVSYFKGRISNVRIVKGTAVYTSSFRVPTAPLTNITNTVLLTVNDSSRTGSTVTPLTIAEVSLGDPTSESPFDDPAGLVFGENKDEGLIKCGEYIGNGAAVGPVITLGWEPQWLLIKNTEIAERWVMFDCMRGIVTGGNDFFLYPHLYEDEASSNGLEVTPTGFKIITSDTTLNDDTEKFMYVAIRRPDGYVGKPVETGTGALAIDTGNSNTAIPNFDSTFPVDFGWAKLTGSANHWYTSARLLHGLELKADLPNAETGGSNKVFDSNVGWHDTNGDSGYISHMWKRHAGFDVVTFKSIGSSGTSFNHNLGKVPEMMWFKNRSRASTEWFVYNKFLNGGTDPEKYALRLSTNASVTGPVNDYFDYTGSAGITATTASGGGFYETGGGSGDAMLCILFASVEGISKLGYYDGSNSAQTISTAVGTHAGFQPRFLLVKRINDTQAWTLLDTVRGWAQSTNDPRLEVNGNAAEITNVDFGYPTSTGFVLEGGTGKMNESGGEFIYYAHA